MNRKPIFEDKISKSMKGKYNRRVTETYDAHITPRKFFWQLLVLRYWLNEKLNIKFDPRESRKPNVGGVGSFRRR